MRLACNIRPWARAGGFSRPITLDQHLTEGPQGGLSAAGLDACLAKMQLKPPILGDRLPVGVTVIALGDEVAIVCLPGEVFVDLGPANQRASPFRTTLVVELSNWVETPYIRTRVAHAAGSYEATNSLVQPGSGERLVEAAVRLLRSAARAASSGGKSP